jgi:site-specific recombinase XerD
MNPAIRTEQIMSTNAIRLDLSPAPRAGGGSEKAEHSDQWEFISGTVIQRFLDCYWVKYGVSRDTLKAYRTDLIAVDRWMLTFRRKSLITATERDVRDFLETKYALKKRTVQNMPSLSCVKRFYRFLLEHGFRADDPTENVFVRTPRLSRRDLTVVSGTRA